MNSADYQANTPYARFGDVAINAPADRGQMFIKQTYIHLMLAIYAFVAFEWLFFSLGLRATSVAVPRHVTIRLVDCAGRVYGD